MKRKDPMPETSHFDRPGAQPTPALAYLTSTYPTLSMPFVLREVLALRELGFQVETASINTPDRALDRPANGLTAIGADQAKRTYYVKQHGLSGATVAKLQTVFGNFGGYWRGVGLAFRLARLDLRRLYLNLMYFIEALMVGQWMKRKGLRHLHVHLASQAASVGLFVHTVFGFGYSLTVHGPDEFCDADRQMLPEKIRATDFLCCISSFARSQLMKVSPYEHWSKFVLSCKIIALQMGKEGGLHSHANESGIHAVAGKGGNVNPVKIPLNDITKIECSGSSHSRLVNAGSTA